MTTISGRMIGIWRYKFKIKIKNNTKEQGGGKEMILLFIYMALGYWATGRTIYANKILIGAGNTIFLQKVIMGTLFGWALIPIAIIKMIL